MIIQCFVGFLRKASGFLWGSKIKPMRNDIKITSPNYTQKLKESHVTYSVSVLIQSCPFSKLVYTLKINLSHVLR